MACNKKVILVASLLMIMLVASMSGQIVNAREDPVENNTLEITYVFNEPTISLDEGIVKVELDNLRKEEIPGKPVIPRFSARILLSQGKDVGNVYVTYGRAILVETGVILEHGQPPVPVSKGEEFKPVDPDPEIYESDKPYPATPFSVGTVAGYCGFNILHVSLYPVRYIPKVGNILYFPEITVHIIQEDGKINPLFRGDPEHIQKISNMVDNPEETGSYSSVSSPETTTLTPGDYDYVIITSASFTDDFQPLLDHKSSYTTTNIVDTTYINTNYAGTDLQEKIRNFIIDAYTNWGTTYVLLGGDVSVIPHRSFYCMVFTFPVPTEDEIPSDLYYAGLDGTWNDDGDGYWGEVADNPDYYAEVYVGRAPVETETEIATFINKVIAFENAAKPSAVQLHQARIQPLNVPDSRSIAEKCASWVPPSYTIDKLYEEDGQVTKTKWRTAFTNDHLIVQHTGHGSTYSYQINYEVGGTAIGWTYLDAYGLVNSFLPIHTSIACHSGGFDSNDCLAENYVLALNGGTSACLLNSRYGWFNLFDASMYSGEFVERQFYELFHGTENLAKMMQDSKEYFASLAASQDVYRWCYYDINLLGDPESPALTMRTGTPPPNNPPNTPSNPNPADTATGVSIVTELSWTGGDPDSGDTVEYDVYFGTSATPPFVTTVTSESYDPGTLAYLTTYYWQIVARDNHGAETAGPTWSFTTGSSSSQVFHAAQDIPVQNGGITGSYGDTHVSDDVYEGITERKVGPRSKLEHKWTIDVTGGYSFYNFYLEAYHNANSEGDDFEFQYSTDGSTYHYMITVSKTSDNDISQEYTLPSSLSGTIYIRVVDTDRTKRNTALDTIYIDHMYIEASGTPPPNRPPIKPSVPDPEDTAINVDINPTLSVSVSDPNGDAMTVTFYDASNNVIGIDAGVASGTRATTVWSGLSYDTPYTWYVIADDGEDTATSDSWSFNTRQEIPPTDMCVFDISWSVRTAGKNKFLSHTITVMSESGTVNDATVYSKLTHEDTGESWTFSGVTDANGQVTFERKCNLGNYKAEVTDITHSTYMYNSSLDLDNPDYYELT
ncbi:MAG: C25 family cysteine peptidase [Candidatus Hodarchaeota archaeon]